MTWTALRDAIEHKHSGTVAVGAAAAVILWYTYAIGLTPEPPTLILAAAAVVAAYLFNQASST
jgi:hypothetical protein